MLQTYRNDSSSRSRENDSYIKFYDYSSRFIPTQTTQFTTNPMRESKMSNKGGTCKDKLCPTDYFRDYVTSPNNLIHHMSKRTQDLSSKTRNNLIESGIDKLHPHYMKFGTKRSPNNRGKLHTLFEFQTMKPSEEYRLYQNAEFINEIDLVKPHVPKHQNSSKRERELSNDTRFESSTNATSKNNKLYSILLERDKNSKGYQIARSSIQCSKNLDSGKSEKQ